jgi:hypothetical protein
LGGGYRQSDQVFKEAEKSFFFHRISAIIDPYTTTTLNKKPAPIRSIAGFFFFTSRLNPTITRPPTSIESNLAKE